MRDVCYATTLDEVRAAGARDAGLVIDAALPSREAVAAYDAVRTPTPVVPTRYEPEPGTWNPPRPQPPPGLMTRLGRWFKGR